MCVLFLLCYGGVEVCLPQNPIGDYKRVGSMSRDSPVQFDPLYGLSYNGTVVFMPDSGQLYRYYIYDDSIVFGNYVPVFARDRGVGFPYNLVIINVHEPDSVYCMGGYEYELKSISWQKKEAVIYSFYPDSIIVQPLTPGPCLYSN